MSVLLNKQKYVLLIENNNQMQAATYQKSLPNLSNDYSVDVDRNAINNTSVRQEQQILKDASNEPDNGNDEDMDDGLSL